MRRMRLLRLTFSLRGISIISSAPQLPTAVPNKTASDWKELARRPGDFCPLPGLTFLKIEIVWSRSSTLNRVAKPSSDQRARPCAPANSPPARPHAIGGSAHGGGLQLFAAARSEPSRRRGSGGVSGSLPAPFATLLLEHGAKINAKMKDGKTPLDFAVSRNQNEIAAFLRGRGAVQ